MGGLLSFHITVMHIRVKLPLKCYYLYHIIFCTVYKINTINKLALNSNNNKEIQCKINYLAIFTEENIIVDRVEFIN